MARALEEILALRARIEALEQADREPIAIVGLACRFPGADDLDAFWELLRDGGDAITEIPAERRAHADWQALDEGAPWCAAAARGGFVDGLDRFDPGFFGISPREARTMDPQQRLLLEVSWEALEQAGIDPQSARRQRTGVFVGMSTARLCAAGRRRGPRGDWTLHHATGTSASVAAGRLSYMLGLQGPSLAVDTACSSSLVAVHLACQSLRSGECDLALAGGVNLILVPELLDRLLARRGCCRRTAGARPSTRRRTASCAAEGCGVVVLKRLSRCAGATAIRSWR